MEIISSCEKANNKTQPKFLEAEKFIEAKVQLQMTRR